MTPGAQERAHQTLAAIVGLLGTNRIKLHECKAIKSILIAHDRDAVTQAVQAAYEHAAEIAQSHQCPHGWHSCGGDIATALRARPTEPMGEKG